MLIKLDLIHLQIAHHAVMETFAAVADAKAEAYYRVAVYVGQAFSRADRAAFGQRAYRLDLFLEWENVHCQPLILLCIGWAATMKEPSLMCPPNPDALK
ncbi:MAG: hypothetical protein Q7S58_14780 [Candidatus Binatus sp.]|uniref:hypothetical protein n=1 Tax=Candidatus Binatus sp. TaxID=2811406 RepID=UPI002719CB76|nr:hypothetical protein [Candidatus Binatus sp.]MDO8433667.1 hypothetical protein [Candidatus Binatus sp.]